MAVAEMGVFLRKICLALLGRTASAKFADFGKSFFKAEDSIRRNLRKACANVPVSIVLDCVPDAEDLIKMKKHDTLEPVSDTPYMKLRDDSALVDNLASAFLKKGYLIGDTMELASDVLGMMAGTVVTVVGVSTVAVTVTVAGRSTTGSVKLSDLRKKSIQQLVARRQRIEEEAARMAERPMAVTYALPIEQQEAARMKSWVSAALYQNAIAEADGAKSSV